MIEVAEVPELADDLPLVVLPKPPELKELVNDPIVKVATNKNVLAVVTDDGQGDLSSLTVPIFSSPATCGDPQHVIGVGKASHLSWGEIGSLLRTIRRLRAIDKKDPDSPIAPDSMERLFNKLLDKPTGVLDLGVYPEKAVEEYERRLLATRNSLTIMADDIVTKKMSDDREIVSVPARFATSRLDITELLDAIEDQVKDSDSPMVIHVPVLQPVVNRDESICCADVYIVFADKKIVIVHDGDRVGSSLQYGKDTVAEVIEKKLKDDSTKIDPLSLVVDILRKVDKVHSETLDLLESRLDEVSLSQRANSGWLKGAKTIAELGRLSVSLSHAQKEVLHLRRTTSFLLSAVDAPEFIKKYGALETATRSRSAIVGINDRLSKDQERILGLKEDIDSMHNTHSACESVSSQKARRLGSYLAVWATPLMGSHYAATLAAEHGLHLHGHLAVASLLVSAAATLWLGRKSLFG